MATYKITAPDGNSYNVTAPDSASQDQVLAYAKANYKSASSGTDWKGVVGEAVKNAFLKPGSFVRDLGTNPVTMAKALPPLASMAGAVSPVPGGATIFGEAGRGISDLALKSLGKSDQIPSGLAHLGELGLNVLGDVGAIPAIKGKIFGGQIGKAEKIGGLITRGADKYPTSGNVGEVLNTLEGQIDNGTITSPQTAKEAYAVTKYIHENPHIVGKSDEITVQAQRVGSKAQKLFNELLPARKAPAEAMAKAYTIPRTLQKVYKGTPKLVKQGLGLTAAGGLGKVGWDLISSLFGNRQ